MAEPPAPEPDSTAVRVALWRALHVEADPPPHVFEDAVGLALAAPDPVVEDMGRRVGEDVERPPEGDADRGAVGLVGHGALRHHHRRRVERVCEVAYDHLQGDRFRHATQFVRWRPDRSPAQCRYDQLEVTPPYELGQIFASGEHHSASPR